MVQQRLTTGQSTIQGLYEICIGVPDPVAALHYWQQFGYRIGQTGRLSAIEAEPLYGVRSALTSLRLVHQTADHGLIRLMVWEQPTNDGLGMTSMKTIGNRWATTLTANLLNILNHAEMAAALDLPIRYTQPYWEVIYQKGHSSRPFVEPAIGVREMLLLQPLTRQVLFQRFGYSMLSYGTIDHHAPLNTSQITHMGLVIQADDKTSLLFYEQVLGLLRARDDVETSYESSPAAQQMFDLAPGERFIVTAFDDPRSSATSLQNARSGRLYIIRFPSTVPLAHQADRSRPGCLGMSLYTYRVTDLADYHDRLQTSSAEQITAIGLNEFGERSCLFRAPDGYDWMLIEG